MKTINMLSRADMVEGQGVLSAYREQVELVSSELGDAFAVSVNRNTPSDIVHYHTINLGYFLTLPFVRMRSKTVGYVHFLPETLEGSIQLPKLAKAVFYRYVIRFYKSMDYLVTVNPDFVDRLASYGIERDRIQFIPNYVSNTQFYPLSARQRRALRCQHGLSPERFTVFCAGQLQKRKGVFDFIELARRMPDVQFIWAGSFAFGGLSDGYREIRAALENPPENLLLTGLIPREEMNAWYNMADCMLLPSFEELFPMTVLEAMSCGIPVVLRDLTLYQNILSGVYESGRDVEGFEAILRRLQREPGFYRQAVSRSLTGSRFYNRERVARMWRCFYEKVLAAAKAEEHAQDEKRLSHKKRALPAASMHYEL